MSIPADSDTILMLGSLAWPGGYGLPKNTPTCGFDGKNPICKIREAASLHHSKKI